MRIVSLPKTNQTNIRPERETGMTSLLTAASQRFPTSTGLSLRKGFLGLHSTFAVRKALGRVPPALALSEGASFLLLCPGH